jgi:hypothetical protein
MQNQLNKLGTTFDFRRIAFVYLIACVIWFLSSENLLGKVAMVTVIVASATYHRIAGIIAVIVAVAFMQRQTHAQKEGFAMQSLQKEGLAMRSLQKEGFAMQALQKEGLAMRSLQKEGLAMPAPQIRFDSAAEFRKKFCMKGVAQTNGNEPMVLQYMLSPALFDDSNSDKPQLKPEVIQQINVSSLSSCTANGSNHMSIANMCDPGCNWTTTAPTTAPPITEGFNPMSALRPHIRTGQRMITDGITNLTASANRLKRQLF